MITEKDREAFLELVFPPLEHELTYCIGTTFTLELPCLIQLALNAQGKTNWDASPGFHREFELINDFAQKSVLFSQNCRIKALPDVNPESLKVFRLLDSIIQEVPSPSKFGVFHPKVWLLRFDPKVGGDPTFRFMVMSRNLTTSKKWDISASVSGTYGKKSHFNDEIIKLLKDLQKRSSIKNKKHGLLRTVITDLEKIEFNFKSRNGFRDFDFFYKWGKSKEWEELDYQKYKKVLVVSPSLCPKELSKLNKLSQVTLVTGLNDIHKLSEFDNLKQNTFVSGVQDLDLHAKMYFCLHDEGTDIIVGSANCTHAAWLGDNVEANAKILSSISAFNNFFNSFIREGGELKPWLMRYDDLDFKVQGESEAEKKQKLLEQVQKEIAVGEFLIDYRERDTVLRYNVEYKLPKEVTGTIRILGHHESLEMGDVLEKNCKLEKISLKDQTSLLEVRLQTEGGESLSFYTVAVTNINRKERNKRVLEVTLKDWDCFWSYLGIVLNFDSKKVIKQENKYTFKENTRTSLRNVSWFLKDDFLEKLMLQVAQNPAAVEKIEFAITALEINSRGRKVPELQRFKQIWRPFKKAFVEFKAHG